MTGGRGRLGRWLNDAYMVRGFEILLPGWIRVLRGDRGRLARRAEALAEELPDGWWVAMCLGTILSAPSPSELEAAVLARFEKWEIPSHFVEYVPVIVLRRAGRSTRFSFVR